MRIFALFACLALPPIAAAQSTMAEIDECGTLIQGNSCVLFQGSSGKYVLTDYGRFHVGDAVRVTGSADANCPSICPDADGCVRGSHIYDPSVLPCGTPISNVQTDLLPNLCTAATGALTTAAGTGLLLIGRRRRARGRRPGAA
jgi:hypothetical protein